MRVSIVVTADQQSVIGNDDTLPWRSQSSHQRLNSLTRRGVIIVGRKHHEAILKRRKGEPLKRPEIIVLSRNPDYSAPGRCFIARSVEEAIEAALARGAEEAFVIGGAETYRATLPIADRIYLSLIHIFSEGNVRFPVFQGNGWEVRERKTKPKQRRDEHPLTFLTFERRTLVQPA